MDPAAHAADLAFVALYQAAQREEARGADADSLILSYRRAADAAPGRAEALHALARICRGASRHREGYEFARRGLAIAEPAEGVDVERWIYRHGLLDELSIHAYWTGRHRESLDACVALLAQDGHAPEARSRFAANARFALERLREALPAGAYEVPMAFAPPRLPSATLPSPAPRILLAILAKQKETMLPLYLRCIEALDYPKSSIVVWVRTNDNTDRTREILAAWCERMRPSYAAIEFDHSNVDRRVQEFGVHDWNALRFRVLARIRQSSLEKTLEHRCDFYFTADVDNFIRPFALRELVATGLPIVAPLLRSIDADRVRYANLHAAVDANGYYAETPLYDAIVTQEIRGLIEMPLVHCTYLVRADVIPKLAYDDGSGRHEYVVFADSARRNGVAQYFDNRQVYGCLTLADDEVAAVERARALMEAD